MKLHRNISRLRLVSLRVVPFVLLGLVIAAPAFAQATSPWENAVGVLQQAFTSTIARGLSLVAIVVSGLTFAFGEGGSKRVLAGVLFGVGIAMNPPPSFPAIVGLILPSKLLHPIRVRQRAVSVDFVRSVFLERPAMNQAEVEVIDSTELAKRLNVPETWVRSWTNAKRTSDPIPHFRLGRYVRFPWGSPELREWLNRQLVSANGQGH